MTRTPRWSLVVDSHAAVGEGPSWDAPSGTLLWVDIIGRLVHRHDPSSGRTTTREVDKQVGAAVTRQAGGLALAMEDGVWVADADAGPLRLFAPIEADDRQTRMNDAKVDPRGRLWAGTMAHDARPRAGALYRIDADGSAELVLDDVTISNGIGWSPDARLMYYIDTATHRIDVLDYDVATGRATRRRQLVQLPGEAGLPDGMAVDAEGCLWVAFYDGWAVRRYAPTGEPDLAIDLPVSRVTSCAFGGRDLGDLYITTARAGLADDELREQPLAGGLFVARPGVRGLPATPFGG